jgi:hypothetical protein
MNESDQGMPDPAGSGLMVYPARVARQLYNFVQVLGKDDSKWVLCIVTSINLVTSMPKPQTIMRATSHDEAKDILTTRQKVPRFAMYDGDKCIGDPSLKSKYPNTMLYVESSPSIMAVEIIHRDGCSVGFAFGKKENLL